MLREVEFVNPPRQMPRNLQISLDERPVDRQLCRASAESSLARQLSTCRRNGSKFRWIRSTPVDSASSSEKRFECFARTGLNTPGTMLPNWRTLTHPGSSASVPMHRLLPACFCFAHVAMIHEEYQRALRELPLVCDMDDELVLLRNVLWGRGPNVVAQFSCGQYRKARRFLAGMGDEGGAFQ